MESFIHNKEKYNESMVYFPWIYLWLREHGQNYWIAMCELIDIPLMGKEIVLFVQF